MLVMFPMLIRFILINQKSKFQMLMITLMLLGIVKLTMLKGQMKTVEFYYNSQYEKS